MSVVSSVLSRVSTRSRPTIGWNVNVSFSSLMDSLFSIAFGLGLRFVVDTVSHQDFKLTGTLVGLWEGVILLHFTKKMPKSSDPYIAFAVRLCVDFFLTESVARLVLVLIWTGLGMILADITPAIWSDVGLNRVWRRLRRDLYTIGQMVPTVAFFPPQRTVRFSPSHAASVIGDDGDDAASDITATEQTPSAPVPPPNPILPPSRDARKRRVPGHYGFEYSDTETERSYAPTPVQPRAGPSTRTSRRLSVYPGQQSASDSMSSLTPDDDIDAGNLSDGASSSGGTERAGPSTTSIINMSEVQGASSSDAAAAPATVAVAPTLDTAAAAAASKPTDDEAGNRTPTQQPLWIPPTPSDSAAAWRLSRAREAGNFDEAIKPMRPLGLGLGLNSGEKMPQIPDFLDEPLTEDWTDLGKPTTIEPTTTTTDPFLTTPTADQTATVDPTAAAPDALESNTLLEPPAYEAWPSGSGAGAAEREYKTAADFDDIYGEEAPTAAGAALDAEKQTADLLGGVEGLGEGAGEGEAPISATEPATIDSNNGLAPTDLTAAADAAIDPEAQAIILEIAKMEQEDEAKRLAEEADAEADRMLKDAEAEAEAKLIADAAEARAREEAEREKEAEAKRLEEALAEEEKRLADALAEAKRLEEEAKRLADEAVAAAAAEAEAAAKKEEKKKKKKTKKDADERKAKEEADEAARQAKRAEEEEKERKAKEEEEKKEAEAKEQKRKDAEAAAERRAQKLREKEEKEAAEKEKERIAKEEEEKAEAERKAQQEEAERKAKEEQEEADRKAKEEEEQRLKEEAEAKEREDKEKEEAERLKLEEEEKKALDEWTTLDKANGADAEADAIAAGAVESALAQDQEQPWEDVTARAPGQEAAEGEPLVNLDEPEPESEQQPAPTTVPAYEESVVSDATVGMPPQDPRERLERSMVLRAQMVEIQNQIDDLKAGGAAEDSPQLKQLEKIMRKMVRQATRRYAAGIECAQYLNGFDDSSDLVSLENVHPGAVIKKIAEQIEYLLSPSAKSLSFSVQCAKKANDAKKQKPKVIELIDEFNLTNYTIENAVNKKISEITIPEEEFGTWVTGYRNLLTRRAMEEEESPWGR